MSSFYAAEKWKERLIIRKSHNTEIAVSVNDVFLQESHNVWFLVSHLIPWTQDEQLRGGPDEAVEAQDWDLKHSSFTGVSEKIPVQERKNFRLLAVTGRGKEGNPLKIFLVQLKSDLHFNITNL